jgi:hypothetical protein
VPLNNVLRNRPDLRAVLDGAHYEAVIVAHSVFLQEPRFVVSPVSYPLTLHQSRALVYAAVNLLMEGMMADDMTTVAQAERGRLTKERGDIEAKMGELRSQLAEVDHKIGAIDAYETALNGKAPTSIMPRRRQGAMRAGHGEKQAQVLKLVEAAAEGVVRGELIEKLGVKGNKSGEQSVSNALNALKKAGKIDSTDGKWHVVAAKKAGGRRAGSKRRKASK